MSMIKDGRWMMGMVAVVGVIVAMLSSSCSTAGVKQRVDLGDGQIFDLLPVSPAAKALNIYKPGAGDALLKIEDVLAARRAANLGKTDTNTIERLERVTSYQFLLKEPVDGLILQASNISTVQRIRAPVVPDSIVDEVSLDDFFSDASKTAAGAGGWSNIISQIDAIRNAQGEALKSVNQPVDGEALLKQFEAARDALGVEKVLP